MMARDIVQRPARQDRHAVVARLTRDGNLLSVAGGGDTVSALHNAGVVQDFSYVSTAGGSLLGGIALGILAAVGTAVVFGALAIRTSGVYFLLLTLALGMIVWGVSLRWTVRSSRRRTLFKLGGKPTQQQRSVRLFVWNKKKQSSWPNGFDLKKCWSNSAWKGWLLMTRMSCGARRTMRSIRGSCCCS